jgi:hypothetical protein
MNKLIYISFFFLLTSCAKTSWKHNSGNNTELNFHSGYCRSLANAKAPTYICKDPFMCKPEEFSLVITALGQNAAEYDHCMYKKGYNAN